MSFSSSRKESITDIAPRFFLLFSHLLCFQVIFSKGAKRLGNIRVKKMAGKPAIFLFFVVGVFVFCFFYASCEAVSSDTGSAIASSIAATASTCSSACFSASTCSFACTSASSSFTSRTGQRDFSFLKRQFAKSWKNLMMETMRQLMVKSILHLLVFLEKNQIK